MTSINNIMRDGLDVLKSADLRSAHLDIELLLCHVLHMTREQLILERDRELSTDEQNEFRKLLSRRAQGEPVAYLIGKKEVFGAEFIVKPGVLIPRPESEHLVEEALQWITLQAASPITICDFGSGSGCIGLSILLNSINTKLLAIDKSEIACEIIGKNVLKHGLGARCDVLLHELGEHSASALPLNVDIVVANPPYISSDDSALDPNVRKYEPHEALFAGEKGLEFILKWKNLAREILRTGGILIMEFGYSQGRDVKDIFENDLGFEKIKIGKDLSGHDRYVIAHRI